MTSVYANVIFYDGRPTNSLAARTEALSRELEDVIHEFDQLTAQKLPSINSELQKKQLPSIQTFTQQDWEKKHQPEGSAPSAKTLGFREID